MTEVVWEVIDESWSWVQLNKVLAMKARIFNIFLKRGKYGDRSQLQKFDSIFRELSKLYFKLNKAAKEVLEKSEGYYSLQENIYMIFYSKNEEILKRLNTEIEKIISEIIHKFQRKKIEVD